MRDRWPTIRAALLALVLLWMGLLASPIPTKVDAGSFDNRIAKAELARWTEILGRVGIQTTPEQLEEQLIAKGGGVAETKKALLKPFRPVQRTLGIGQAWGLFTYPNTWPHRIHISVRSDSSQPWEPIYVALDPEHDWNKSTFVYRRIRGVYDDNASRTRPSYGHFVEWVAGLAFQDYPEANEVRVHMVRSHVAPPDEEPDPDTDVRLSRVVRRSELGL